MSSRIINSLFLLIVITSAQTSFCYAKNQKVDYKHDEILVRFAPNKDKSKLKKHEKNRILSDRKCGSVKKEFKRVSGFTLLSTPVDFQVVPEPATFLLFGTGFICIRWNRLKRPVNRNCSILFKNFKQIRESGFRFYPAGLCPGNKFRDVHPSVGGFAVVDIALGFTEYFSNLTLRKSRILPELPQIAGNQSVFHAMLRFCRHIYEFSTKTS